LSSLSLALTSCLSQDALSFILRLVEESFGPILNCSKLVHHNGPEVRSVSMSLYEIYRHYCPN